eukprot:TRINITY_DN4090_c0_g2_i1.p1 TRINITY_DN4090_c0_g2~~TRINITY_DN4090_c0_g2_i1.p1  ORF type:complete len:162 (-),score=29.30 TRINITY_DN4090_c0_g2_i1:126-611(-)
MGSAAGTFKSKAQVIITEFDDVRGSPKPNKEGRAFLAFKRKQPVRTDKVLPEGTAAVIADADITKSETDDPAKGQEANGEESHTVDRADGGVDEDESLSDMISPCRYRREDFYPCEFSASSYRLVYDPEHEGPGPWIAWSKDSATHPSSSDLTGSSDEKCN